MGVDPSTLSIFQGEVQSAQRDSMAALMAMDDGSVKLHWPPFDLEHIVYAAGAGPLFLHNGQNRGRSDSRHPRSAVGLDKEGRYLIFMVIDGRNLDYSIGATLAEAANWMADLGCWNALNLDGGGSSTLVLKDPDSGEWIVINEPSGPPARGEERAVANQIGIK
jgi:exopolysaccharide biosynthesis protein